MKEFWKKLITCSVLAVLVVGAAVTVPGCKEDSPIEEAAEETGEAIEEAGEEVQDAVEDAADAVEDEM